MATNIIAGITKTVKYNRANKDFDCYVAIDGGEPLHIGYANSQHEGESKCNTYAYEYLTDTHTDETAAELLMQDEPTAAQLGQRLCAARADILADEDVTIIKFDIRTEAERRYDAERDGSAYVKPVVDETPVVTQNPKHISHDNILIGVIDGCEVRAEYMPDDPDEGNGELAAAKVAWQGITIATDGSSYLSLPMDGGFVGDMEIAQWSVIKRVAHTDICEQLIAIAQRYPTYQSVLASAAMPAVSGTIHVVRNVSDDRNSPDFGQEFGTDYVCGESIIHFPDSGEPPTLMTYDTDDNDGDTERNLNDLIILLNSPEVRAARLRAGAGVPLKQAA